MLFPIEVFYSVISLCFDSMTQVLVLSLMCSLFIIDKWKGTLFFGALHV
jgi:hypothetical protein